MSWTNLTWRPLDAAALPAAAPLADIAATLRSAIEEALRAERGPTVAIARAEVAELRRSALPEGSAPIATVELVGAPRRLVLAAVEPSPETAAEPEVLDPAAVGTRVLRAVDAAIAEVAGEGLGLGPADAALLAEEADLVALRLVVGRDDVELGGLILVAEAPAVAELAAHVAALRALALAAGPEAPPSENEGAGDGTAEAARASAEPRVAATPSDAGPADVGSDVGDPAGPSLRAATFPDLGPPGLVASTPEPGRSIDLLLGVQLQVSVEIGRTSLPIREVLALAPGSIIELDKLAGEKADILVNGHPVAQGEVVVVDENFGVRITDVASRQRRILSADGAP